MQNSKTYFIFLLLFLLFGVMLYDFIGNRLGFSYTDEILTLMLFVIMLFSSMINVKELKIFGSVMFVFVFYLIYSIIIRSNYFNAIVGDFFVQIKPYIAFACTMFIAPKLSDTVKKVLKGSVVVFALVLFADAVYTIFMMGELEHGLILLQMHPSRLATASIILALTFLYLSDTSKKSIWLTFLILSIGLLSLRGKMYGFWVLAVSVLMFFKNYLSQHALKVNVKTIMIITAIAGIVFFVASEKFQYYFIIGNTGDFQDSFARPALYQGSFEILKTHIPFGSGFGSYATFFSGEYYSPMYHKLGLDETHGLTPDYKGFIADTYFPALAQFGITGLFLFFYFWYYVLKRAYRYKSNVSNPEISPKYLIIILIIAFFMIESIADSTLTQNRGVFMMIMLAMCLNDLKQEYLKN